MPITIRFEKKDKDGNTYYEDTNGNRIEEVEPTPEEIAAKDEEYYRWVDELNRQHEETSRKAKPFLLKSLGNLQKPRARKPLWAAPTTSVSGHSNTPTVYWSERELCILAGDNGVGKSLMALNVARQLLPPPPAPPLEGRGVIADLNSPLTGGDVERSETEGGNRVLYIDWELREEDFVQRWGGEEVPGNFFWAGFNMDSKMPQHVPDKIEWLLQNFATTVKDTEANILIIDQPDRLHLSPQKWTEFLTKLKALMREFNLSVMLILSNKSRHTGRACGLNNIPKGNILIPCADSVVMLCQNQRRSCERYFKVLKNRNRAAAENLEFVDIIEVQETDGFLTIEPWGRQSERSMLPPNAAERKNQKIMEAEKLWNTGLSCLEVAEQMYVAESTIKSWLRPLWNSYPPQPLPTSREGLILPLREGGDVEQRETEGVRNG